MGIDSNWLSTVVPNLHWLRCPFLVPIKTEKVCTNYAPAMQRLCNFRTFFIGGIDSNLRPCVLRSVVKPPFRPPVIGSIDELLLLSKSGPVKRIVPFFSFHTRLAKLVVPFSHGGCFRACGFGFSIPQSPRWCVRAKAEWRYQTEKQWIRIGFIGYYVPFSANALK